MTAHTKQDHAPAARAASTPIVTLSAYLSPDFAARRRILDAATQLFRARGYMNVAMSDIAAAVGLSKPGLYHHWASKDALLMTIVSLSGEILLNHLEAVRSSEADPVRRLQSYIVSRLQTVTDYQDIFTVVWQERTNVSSESFGELARNAERYRTHVRQIIDEAKAADGVRPEIDSHLLMLALDGMTGWAYFWYKPSGGQQPEAIGHAFWGMLSSGILTKQFVDGEFNG